MGWYSKIRRVVRFEEYFNLGEFTESGEPVFYSLIGVVAQRGLSIQAGHSVAEARQTDGRNFCVVSDDHAPMQEWLGMVGELGVSARGRQGV